MPETEARLKKYISFDSDKHYIFIGREHIQTKETRQYRIDHAPGAIRRACRDYAPGTIGDARKLSVELLDGYFHTTNG